MLSLIKDKVYIKECFKLPMKLKFLLPFCILMLMYVFSTLSYGLNLRSHINNIISHDKEVICMLDDPTSQNDNEILFPCQDYEGNILCGYEDQGSNIIDSIPESAHFKNLDVYINILTENILNGHIIQEKSKQGIDCLKYLKEWSSGLSLNAKNELDIEKKKYTLNPEIIRNTTTNFDSYNQKVIDLEKEKTICESSLANINRIIPHYPPDSFIISGIINIKNDLETFLEKYDELLQLLYKRNKNGLYSGYVYTSEDFKNNVNNDSDLPVCPTVLTQVIADNVIHDCKVYFSNCLFTFAINNMTSTKHDKSETMTLYQKNNVDRYIKPLLDSLYADFIEIDKYPNSVLTKQNNIKFILTKYLLTFSPYTNEKDFLNDIINISTAFITRRMGSTLFVLLNLLPDSYADSYYINISYMGGTNLSENDIDGYLNK